MKTQDRANKLVSILLGEADADDYLNKLGIVRHSKSTPPPPVKVSPDSLAGKILSGNALATVTRLKHCLMTWAVT